MYPWAGVSMGAQATIRSTMDLRATALVCVVWLGALLGPTPARAEAPLTVDDVLSRADEMLAVGEFSAAEQLLSTRAGALEEDVLPEDRFTLHYALALVRVRLERHSGAVASFVEAIAQADRLESGETPGFEGAAVSVRLELAALLMEAGRHEDSESICWDALGRALDRQQHAVLSGVLSALVSAVFSQQPSEEDLRSLLAELDAELHRLEGYRLSLPPPPEPILVLLEAGASRMLAEGEPESANELFGRILALDRARGADWRLVPDLSAVAFSALLVDDLPQARGALRESEGLLGGAPVSVDLWANRCYLSALEGSWEGAEAQCLAGIAAASASEDEPRVAGMVSVLAGLQVIMGQPQRAASLLEDAAQRYDRLGRPGEADSERAGAIIHLAEARHLDEALRLLQDLDRERTGEPRHPRVEESRQRLALHLLLSSFDSSDSTEVKTTLQNLGTHLFETGRAVDLSELSLIYLDLALREDRSREGEEDLDLAVAAVATLEEDLGLANPGWVGAHARALLHARREEYEPAIEEWQAALTPHEERLLGDALSGGPLRAWMGRAPAPFYRRSSLEPHRALLALFRSLNREVEAKELEARMTRVRRALAWRHPAGVLALSPRDEPEERLLRARAERDQLLRHLVEVSMRGGETPPAEQRAVLQPLLARARQAEDEALSEVAPYRRALLAPGLPGATGGTAVSAGELALVDLSSLACRVGGLGGAEIFLVAGRNGGEGTVVDGVAAGSVLGPSEVVDLSWPGPVLLPLCEGPEPSLIATAVAIQGQAFFHAGAPALIRQTRPAPRRARKLFGRILLEQLEAGAAPEAAYEAAMDRVRARFRAPRIRTAWELTLQP